VDAPLVSFPHPGQPLHLRHDALWPSLSLSALCAIIPDEEIPRITAKAESQQDREQQCRPVRYACL
jgi:hypothetical protein